MRPVVKLKRNALLFQKRAFGRNCIEGDYLGLTGSSAVGALVAGLLAVLAGVLSNELGGFVPVVVESIGLVPVTGATWAAFGFAGVTGAGGRSVFPSCCMFFSMLGLCLTSCAFRIQSKKVRTKKIPVTYLVILVSAVPLPAPNKASVAPPPKAWPMPASFLGN